MFSQLAQSFPRIEKEILSKICDYCNEDLNEANELLNFITDNHVYIDKEIILKNWVRRGQIYLLAMLELNKICKANTKKLGICENVQLFVNCNMHRIGESNEIKIIKELCLHVLWNLLSNPKKMKYRQISNSLLFRNLKNKCEEMASVLEIIRHNLEEFGLQNKINGNWYYRGSVPPLSLWKHYCKCIKEQLMLCIYHFNCHLIFQNPSNDIYLFMRLKGKWKEYEIAFDYQHGTIMLLNKINEEKDEKEEQNKFKIEALQVGNPKKSSLEVYVYIQWYNDFDDIEANCIKWTCLILNNSWHFRTNDSFEMKYLSNFCAVG
ncbi:hypothetical protein RFI_36707 [Reticulomyxa filosa]|uniref:Uncharacterized protein n=1 Tax=Reticulomyxa filosa TaxID=46433 RepID=X6LFG1_RETFI|nr:hypothetical protein RFI_36707 [Reticulomyxa filosa]|eukprot:ETO00733.1 hypothetical protein RFI_36707 [Reticulomyxa filosa]